VARAPWLAWSGSPPATRHLALLNEVLGLEIGKPPSDSTFRYLFLQLDVEAFETLLLQWMSQQPALADGVDSLVCDGKTLRGSIDQKPGAAATFIAQVSLYSQALGVAIAQTTYATDESSETAALQRLLSGIELTWPRWGSSCGQIARPDRGNGSFWALAIGPLMR